MLNEHLREKFLETIPKKVAGVACGTSVGLHKSGFHFFGVEFEVARMPQAKAQAVNKSMHPHAFIRSSNKVARVRSTVHPATREHSLYAWAVRWHSITGESIESLIRRHP